MPLSAERARGVYDRIGRLQDTQRFYEDAATKRLAELAELDHAGAVVELGCGTGRVAEELLGNRFGAGTRYLGVEISPKMAELARRRLSPWSARARVELIEPPGRELPGDEGGFDRFLAAYVFDLLSVEDARALLAEARRLLAGSGLLGVVGLTHGNATLSRLVSRAWDGVSRRWPSLLGGCRPIELSELLDERDWRLRHREVVSRFGVPSEVVLAERL